MARAGGIGRMSIRPEYRALYGAEWRAYRLALIAARGQFCSRCKRAVSRYLNLAHLTHDPRSKRNRAASCAACSQSPRFAPPLRGLAAQSGAARRASVAAA